MTLTDQQLTAAPDVEPAVLANGTISRVKSEALNLRDQAAERARSAAESGLTRATQAIDGVAELFHDNADRLGAQTTPQIADYAHRAADALDGFSQTLRTKSVDELVSDVKDFVRKSPAIAIGVAVAVGFALTRLAKAGTTPTSAGGYRGVKASGRKSADLSA